MWLHRQVRVTPRVWAVFKRPEFAPLEEIQVADGAVVPLPRWESWEVKCQKVLRRWRPWCGADRSGEHIVDTGFVLPRYIRTMYRTGRTCVVQPWDARTCHGFSQSMHAQVNRNWVGVCMHLCVLAHTPRNALHECHEQAVVPTTATSSLRFGLPLAPGVR